MANKYSILTAFKLIDQATAPLDKIGIKGTKVGNALKKDFMKAQDQVNNFGKSLQKLGGYAVLGGIAAISAGIVIATKQFIDYDSAITAATAKFKDLDVTSKTYSQSLKQIGQVARDVAAVTEYTAVDTAGALDKMAMAGLTSEQSMKLLMGTTNLATAAGMDLTTAVDIATDSLGAFGLMTEDASLLQNNLDRLSDVMAKATNMFNTDMAGMFESIKKGAPAFTAAGQSVESFSSLVGVMASSGIKGSESGTQLRNIMLSLANPTGKAADAIKQLGIRTKDNQGNFLDVIDIIEQFEKATKNMGNAQKTAALATIFGSRTVTGMNILLQEGSDKLRDYRKQLENAGGSAANIANAMRGSIKNKIEVLKSALTELGFKFVEVFQEKGVGIIEDITNAISTIDPKPIIDGMVLTANILSGVIKIIWDLRLAIISVALAWGVYKAAMIGAVIVSNIMGFIRAVQTLMMMQKGMNVVQAAFNVLLMANPIGLVIAGIAALIAIIILCVKNLDKITAALKIAGEWIKNVASMIRDGLYNAFNNLKNIISENSEKVLALITIFTGPFGFIVSIIKELWDNWSAIVEAFQSEGILAGFKKIGAVILSAVLAPIQGLLEMLAKIPGVNKLLGPAVEKMKGLRESLKGNDVNVTQNVTPALASYGLPPQYNRTMTTTAGATTAATRPMTSAEQYIYRQNTNREEVDINVRAEQGTVARVTNPPRAANVTLNTSGSNY